MKVKIPKEIRIGIHRVSIKYEKGMGDNFGKRGQARYGECEIPIDPEKSTDTKKTEALMHELLHFIDDIYNSGRLEEYEIATLANGISILLDDLGVEMDWSDII